MSGRRYQKKLKTKEEKLVRKQLQTQRTQASQLQATVRMRQQRVRFLAMRAASVLLQSVQRGLPGGVGAARGRR